MVVKGMFSSAGPGLKSLLTACSENELRTALSILQSLVYRFK